MRTKSATLPILFFASLVILAVVSSAAADDDNVLLNLHKVSLIASTVPNNGDLNPYGVARVPRTIGNLVEGHTLVSNFNNSTNAQGTGTTIVDIAPDGAVRLFAQINPSMLPGPCPGGVGLTTALVVLRTGWVIVGSLPTTNGMSATAEAGCLIVLNSSGNPVETFAGGLINGPWDMTAFDGGDEASLFVTNVLNDTVEANGAVVYDGTVIRINLRVSQQKKPWIESIAVIGSGFAERTDVNALVIGPTGVGLSPNCSNSDPDDCNGGFGVLGEPVLYVADTLNNRIQVIPNPMTRFRSAGTGFTLSSGGNLNAPLGLTVAEGGHILTVNGGNGYITEITPLGRQIARTLLDNSGTPPGSGALFGLIVEPNGTVVFVDDATNTLEVLH